MFGMLLRGVERVVHQGVKGLCLGAFERFRVGVFAGGLAPDRTGEVDLVEVRFGESDDLDRVSVGGKLGLGEFGAEIATGSRPKESGIVLPKGDDGAARPMASRQGQDVFRSPDGQRVDVGNVERIGRRGIEDGVMSVALTTYRQRVRNLRLFGG